MGLKEIVKEVKPVLPPDLPYPQVRFYARPGGRHFHTNKNCPMLNGGQYEHYKYKPITLDEVEKKWLETCACINDTLCSHFRLTVVSVRSLLRRCGWREVYE